MTPSQYRAIREAAGFTQGQLAEALGLSRMTINRREQGVPGYPISAEAALAIRAIERAAKARKHRLRQ